MGVSLSLFFVNKNGLSNNPGTSVMLGFQFCHILSSHICITMHFIPVKMSRNLVLLINNPSKRGDVETWARSLVSPSSQVKMKLKLTTSR